MSRLRILATGATGFLGSMIRSPLEAIADVTYVSRTQDHCLKANLIDWDGGIDPEKIKGQFDIILHMAGLYDLRVSEKDAFLHNITTTRNTLSLCEKAKIPHFVFISTVAVAMGLSQNIPISPDKFKTRTKFPDFYSMSKAYAENLVRYWKFDSLKSKVILRLGPLVGDSKQGKISRIDGPYYAPYCLGKIQKWIKQYPGPLPLPGKPRIRIPILPVDTAAEAIVKICDHIFTENLQGLHSYNLTPKLGLSTKRLYGESLNFLELNEKKHFLTSLIPDRLSKQLALGLVQFPKEEMEYLLNFPNFDSSKTIKLLGPDWCPEFKQYQHAFWSGYAQYISHS